MKKTRDPVLTTPGTCVNMHSKPPTLLLPLAKARFTLIACAGHGAFACNVPPWKALTPLFCSSIRITSSKLLQHPPSSYRLDCMPVCRSATCATYHHPCHKAHRVHHRKQIRGRCGMRKGWRVRDLLALEGQTQEQASLTLSKHGHRPVGGQ